MMSANLPVRVARADDAEAMLAIYAPIVERSAITFETLVPDVAAMRERIVARLHAYPWLAWEEDGELLAYAYAERFRERAAYDWIVETSIYVRADAQRRGIARRLYGTLFDTLRMQGVRQAVGVIALPGATSVALHEALGFEPAGVWRHAGFKLGRWWDVGVWQKTLDATTDAPAPMLPFREMAAGWTPAR